MVEQLVRVLFAPDVGNLWGERGGSDVQAACLKARVRLRQAGFGGCMRWSESSQLFQRSNQDGVVGFVPPSEQYSAVIALPQQEQVSVLLITTSVAMLTLARRQPQPGVVVPSLADLINEYKRREYFRQHMHGYTKVQIVNYVAANADKLYLIATGALALP